MSKLIFFTNKSETQLQHCQIITFF